MRRSVVATTTLPTLVAALLLAGCGPSAAPPAPDAPPSVTRAQVGWMNTMCQETSALAGLRGAATSDPPERASTFGTDYDSTATSYLSSTPTTVDGAADAVGALPPISDPAAERLVADYRAQLGRIRGEVDRVGEENRLSFGNAEQSRQAAGQMGRVVASLVEPQPDLAHVASGSTLLARAYDLAPACDPRVRQRAAGPAPLPGPSPAGQAMLPRAADGTNTRACASGRCEVLLTQPSVVDVGGTAFEVDTDRLPVSVVTRSASGGSTEISAGIGSTSSVGNASRTVAITVLGAADGAAVIRFTTQ